MGFSEVTQRLYRIFFESFLKLNNSVAILLCFAGAKVIFLMQLLIFFYLCEVWNI